MTYGTRSGGSGFNLRASLQQWAKGWLSGGPHFIIGPRYLLRWYVIPRNPWLNVYLHQFLHDDEDRALHDHPWWFVSLMVKGRYYEVTQTNFIARTAPCLAYRPAIHAHRVVLQKDDHNKPIPCWTLDASLVTGDSFARKGGDTGKSLLRTIKATTDRWVRDAIECVAEPKHASRLRFTLRFIPLTKLNPMNLQ